MYDLHDLLLTLLTIVVVLAAVPGICSYLIYLERKLAAFVQDRIGPNRVGPLGLFQPIADGLKFLFKEDIIPDRVDKLLYLLAPAVAMGTALLALAVVPFGPTSTDPKAYQFVIAPRVNIGILFVFAVSSLTVYGILLGGWSSNNKYSLLGALRSSAQIISYEIPMGLSILGVVLFTGSLNLERIIQYQANGFFWWNIWYQPLAFLLFFIAVLAECNRLPFDLPEAEQELIGGYHTEYSALKFGLFFLGEYTHMITTSLLVVILFFGGWHFPWIAEPGFGGAAGTLVKLAVMGGKVLVCIFIYMMLRWTLPRFRFDQLMGLAWKVLIPLALANLVCVMVVLELRWNRWWLLLTSAVLLIGSGVLMLGKAPAARPSWTDREGEPVAIVTR
jgi:NADH-quinone oxidoreductase subunit H